MPLGIQLESLCQITSYLPVLAELHLVSNALTHLRPDAAGAAHTLQLPETLELLNLEDNNITDWDDVLAVGHLPNLHTLILSSNSIKAVTSIPEGAFPAVRSLSLTSNKIDSWASIEALQSLTKLADFRYKGNPLFDGKPGLWSRQLVISRLPSITRLNGSDVTPRERMIAERYFLTNHAQEYWSAKMLSKKVNVKTPLPLFYYSVSMSAVTALPVAGQAMLVSVVRSSQLGLAGVLCRRCRTFWISTRCLNGCLGCTVSQTSLQRLQQLSRPVLSSSQPSLPPPMPPRRSSCRRLLRLPVCAKCSRPRKC